MSFASTGTAISVIKDPISRFELALFVSDSRSVIAEVDEDADAKLDLDSIRAEPLKPVVH